MPNPTPIGAILASLPKVQGPHHTTQTPALDLLLEDTGPGHLTERIDEAIAAAAVSGFSRFRFLIPELDLRLEFAVSPEGKLLPSRASFAPQKVTRRRTRKCRSQTSPTHSPTPSTRETPQRS